MDNQQLTTILQQIDPNIYTIPYQAKAYIYTLDKTNHKLYLGLYSQQDQTLHLRDTPTTHKLGADSYSINLINLNDPHFIKKFTNWLNNYTIQQALKWAMAKR